jgi:hypothetical protein
VVVDAGLTFVVGTHPTPIIINTVFRTHPSVAPLELFARSQAFYKAIGHRFTLLTTDHADATQCGADRAHGDRDDALGAIRASRPDLLMIDLRTGSNELHGWDIAQEVREEPEFDGLPVLVCSADLRAL